MNEQKRSDRKENLGVVTSNRMDKTVIVEVTTRMRHPKYEKVVTSSQKYYAHDETDSLQPGQKVRIMQTRPLSKLKRWRVVEVL